MGSIKIPNTLTIYTDKPQSTIKYIKKKQQISKQVLKSDKGSSSWLSSKQTVHSMFSSPICSLCTKDAPPLLTFKSCVMPKDCQTSDWSSWSPCSKTCRSADLSPGYRLRSRIMTQIPAGGGRRCPALEEKEACNIIGDLLPNCPR